MIVVDASAWVRALVDAGPLGDASRTALIADPDWAAPAHTPVEVLRTLRRYEVAGLLDAEKAGRLAASVSDAEVRYVGPEPWLVRSVWQLRHNLGAYDAPYVAISATLDAPLITLDERLASAARAFGVDVMIPGE